jgi:hypothetical protein
MVDLKRAVAATLLALALTTPTAVAAGPAGDRVFTEGALNGVPVGSALIYGHLRDGAAGGEQLHPISDGEVRVTLRSGPDGSREAVVALSANGRLRELNPFPASVGNPLLLTFLESSLRAIARVTGGSPFYIRNRMKEALRDGGEIAPVTASVGGEELAADAVTFHPFANDKNRHRMGDFAGLELRFVMSDQAPGGFVLFSATTRSGADGSIAFREEIALREVREGG